MNQIFEERAKEFNKANNVYVHIEKSEYKAMEMLVAGEPNLMVGAAANLVYAICQNTGAKPNDILRRIKRYTKDADAHKHITSEVID